MKQDDVIAERYELVEFLGRGGYGEVWKGFDKSLDRHVAAKFIRADAFPTLDRRREAEQRFRREARVTARIQHPGVPVVYDVGAHGESLYLMMQFIDGIGVHDLLHEHRPLPVAWAAAITAQICSVLTVAHAESLIHRDLKPRNLIMCPDGTVKVLDFGIVAVLGSADITQITRVGEGVGTAYYMSPELAITGKASAQSDLYALGCVLHELLAGTRVFESAHTVAEMSRHYSETPPPLRSLRPDVPVELEKLVLELLAKKAASRPTGAWEVYERLLPFVVALPPLPGATTAAPSPDPMRMYATVVERIAATALTGPRVPAPRPAGVSRFSEAELLAANERAEELAVDGRFSQAIELLESALRGADDVLPKAHPVVFALRMRLTDSRFAARDYQQAAREYEELLPELAGMLGSDHQAVLGCRLNQALCSAALGRNEIALSQMRVLLADMRSALGDSDPLTLELRRELGELLAKLGDHERAREVLRPLLADMVAVHGADHPEAQRARALLENLDRLAG
ncbi:serine/threonine-protein kinase [Microtetraspora sp. NBRC 16547]|uniref:serine/threonine-protein kinase n=1 Tax=Microtetraspora sp. NBRC 16547 TaxID=3030993 RepID=UPI0024A19191|nr:serine/threonine-protein kinase [Microtetraspora sp. NBRC 16547]GLW98774.1 protein kinase [Microtetraspora sp. NBRC 16547]